MLSVRFSEQELFVMKRVFDVITAIVGIALLWPAVLILLAAIWLQDMCSPVYASTRVGLNGVQFTLYKLRSMRPGADKSGVDSTASDDPRLTSIGRLIRTSKLDELPQLWNVIKGDMSVVGPRPNVKRETDLYTSIERVLLSVKPGLTDIASIVFSDLGDILYGSLDPDTNYNQLVRPWKSRLSLLYVEHRTFLLDIRICYLTAVGFISRRWALDGVRALLIELDADSTLVDVASRRTRLVPYPPPGSSEIVAKRN